MSEGSEVLLSLARPGQPLKQSAISAKYCPGDNVEPSSPDRTFAQQQCHKRGTSSCSLLAAQLASKVCRQALALVISMPGGFLALQLLENLLRRAPSQPTSLLQTAPNAFVPQIGHAACSAFKLFSGEPVQRISGLSTQYLSSVIFLIAPSKFIPGSVI